MIIARPPTIEPRLGDGHLPPMVGLKPVKDQRAGVEPGLLCSREGEREGRRGGPSCETPAFDAEITRRAGFLAPRIEGEGADLLQSGHARLGSATTFRPASSMS